MPTAEIGDGPLQRRVVWTLTILAALGLAWRGRAPIVVGLGTCVAFAATWLLAGDPDSGPVTGFLALAVAFYTIGGADRQRHTIRAGVAAVVVFLGASVIRQAVDGKGTIRAGAYLVFLVAWLAGREIRRRRHEHEELRGRVSMLESERRARDRAAVADERARIARELHDVVAHSVSVMVVQAQAGPRLGDDRPAILATFQSIEDAGREALVELRQLLGILRRDDGQLAIGPQPGLDSLPSLIDQTRDAGVVVDLCVEGPRRPLPPGVDLSAYRIVQEALTNTLRHAQAANAAVVLRYTDAALSIEVNDDGRGPPPNGSVVGHGLIGMRERAALYGGSLESGPAEGGGFAVRAVLPIAAPA